jgi:hypothetical protein
VPAVAARHGLKAEALGITAMNLRWNFDFGVRVSISRPDGTTIQPERALFEVSLGKIRSNWLHAFSLSLTSARETWAGMFPVSAWNRSAASTGEWDAATGNRIPCRLSRPDPSPMKERTDGPGRSFGLRIIPPRSGLIFYRRSQLIPDLSRTGNAHEKAEILTIKWIFNKQKVEDVESSRSHGLVVKCACVV